jgi:hypothetical protein
MGNKIFFNSMTQPRCQKEKEEEEKATRLKVLSWIPIWTAMKTKSYSFLLSFVLVRRGPDAQ